MDRLRRWLPALLAGVIAEFGVAVAFHQGWIGGTLAGLAFLPTAVILGWAFGAARGIAAALLPLLVLGTLDQLRARPAAGAIAAIAYVALLLAFLAGMTGAMRARYRR